jgi:beta-lactamase class A
VSRFRYILTKNLIGKQNLIKMNKIGSRTIVYIVLIALAASSALSQSRANIEIVPSKSYSPAKMRTARELETVLDQGVLGSLHSRPDNSYRQSDVAATLIDVHDPDNLRTADFRGDERIYPASVIKLFYMNALERQLEDGKVTSTPELQRGLKDMIVVSSNEATQYILDVLTDTSSGAELPADEFTKWQSQRNRVNRFYASMGYPNINVNQKTFCEDAYGIEQQSRNYKGQNRNMLTTNATARLLAEIVLGRMNTPQRTQAMMDLLKRDPFKKSDDPDSQDIGFSGMAFIDMKMTGVKFWAKAGWTSTARHDAAYIETPDGLKLVLVIFTENHANDRSLIPQIVEGVVSQLRGQAK